MLAHTGLKAGLAERFRALLNIFQNGGEIARELIETRCHRGADIARKMRFSEAVAQGIQNLDEHWNGGGQPHGLARRGRFRSTRASRCWRRSSTCSMTQSAPRRRSREVRAPLRHAGSIRDWSRRFARVAARPEFWDDARGADDLRAEVFALEPAQHETAVDEEYLDDIAAAFAQVIDSKSPYHQRPQRARRRCSPT